MLVLTRKPGESIRITDKQGRIAPINIMITDVDRNKVRIGIAAELSLEIVRTELIQTPETKRGNDDEVTEGHDRTQDGSKGEDRPAVEGAD